MQGGEEGLLVLRTPLTLSLTRTQALTLTQTLTLTRHNRGFAPSEESDQFPVMYEPQEGYKHFHTTMEYLRKVLPFP